MHVLLVIDKVHISPKRTWVADQTKNVATEGLTLDIGEKNGRKSHTLKQLKLSYILEAILMSLFLLMIC